MGCAGSSDVKGDFDAGFPLAHFEPAPSQRLRDSATRRRTVYRAQPFPVPADFADRVCISVNPQRELWLCDPDHAAARSMDLDFSFVRHEHREDGVVRDAWYEVHPLCDPRARLGRLVSNGYATLLDETQCASNELRQKGLTFRFRLQHVKRAALPPELRDAPVPLLQEAWCLKSIDDGTALSFAFSLAYQRAEMPAADQYHCKPGDGDEAGQRSLPASAAPSASDFCHPTNSIRDEEATTTSLVPSPDVVGSKGYRNVMMDASPLFTLRLQHGHHARDAEAAAELHDILLEDDTGDFDFESHTDVREAAASRQAFCNRAIFHYLCDEEIDQCPLLKAASKASKEKREEYEQLSNCVQTRLKIRDTLCGALGSYIVGHMDDATANAALPSGASANPAAVAAEAASAGSPSMFNRSMRRQNAEMFEVELADVELQVTPRVTVMVSGGGWRALVSAVNFFDALAFENMMRLVHSVTGLSGGAWAITLALMSPWNEIQEDFRPGLEKFGTRTLPGVDHPPPGLVRALSKENVDAASARVSENMQRNTVGDSILRVAKGAVAATVTSLGSWVSKSLTNSASLLKAIASNSERTMLFNFAELLHQQFLSSYVSRTRPLADASHLGVRAPLAFAAVNSKTYREPSGKGNYGHPHLWHVFDNVGGGGTQFLGAPRIPLDRIELVHHFVEQHETADSTGAVPKSLFAGEPITPCSLMAMCGSAGASWSEVVKAFDGEGFVGKLHVHDTPLREAKGSGRHYTHLQDAGIDCNLPFPVVTEGVGGVGPSDVVLCLDSCLCGRVPTELTKGMAKRYWRGAFSDTSRGVTTAFAPGEVRVFFPAPGSGHPVLVYGFGDTESATMQMDRTREEIEACRRQVFATTQRMNQALQWVLTLGQRDVPAKGYAIFADAASPPRRHVVPKNPLQAQETGMTNADSELVSLQPQSSGGFDMQHVDSSSLFDPDVQFAMAAASSIGRFPLSKISAGAIGDRIILSGPAAADSTTTTALRLDPADATDGADGRAAMTVRPPAATMDAAAVAEPNADEDGVFEVQLTNTSFIDAYSPAASVQLGVNPVRRRPKQPTDDT